MDNKQLIKERKNNTLAIRPTKDDCTELYEFTLMQGSTYFSLANRKFHDSKIKRIGFIDTKTDYGNLFTIYSTTIYKKVDLILAIEENTDKYNYYDNEKQYKIILINGKDIMYFSNNLKDIDYYDNYKSAKDDFEYLLDSFKNSITYNQSHKTYFKK
tara:strand:- start:2200 stop:2670 length:471 start_codon:yes stop_codon:yes gene_type:complete